MNSKQRLFRVQLAGATFVAVLGTLLHFLYDWTGGFVGVAPVAAVNESTWEHMKLAFFPMALWTPIGGRLLGGGGAYLPVKLFGSVLGTAGVPVLFYTYQGAFGPSPAWLNIAFFFLSVGLAFFVEARLLMRGVKQARRGIGLLCTAAFGVQALLFFLFTFLPPHLPLFCDPLTGTYGI